MIVSYITPFRMFKSFLEFYAKLSAAIAFSTIDAAARMIPTAAVRAPSTESAAISEGPQNANSSNLVAPGANSSPQKRKSSPRKRRAAHKTPRKSPKGALATSRRKVA
jgi:hypothetical protein